MKTRKKTGVSVVIPSFNNKEKLFRLIDSAQKLEYPNFEIIICDNSSTNKILSEGRKKYRRVKWLDLGRKNLGQSYAYSFGFANAKPGNHVLYCDEDVVLDYKMLTFLINRLESKENIGMVTPMVLYLENKNWVNQAGAEVSLTTGRVTIGWGPKKDFLKAIKIQGSGTVMLFRNTVIGKLGALEDWFICYLDPEYCVRAAKAGFESWYEPKAVCYHDQPMDPTKWRPRVLSRAYLLGRNRTLFMRKYGNMFVYTLFVPLLLGYYLIESLRFNIFNKWLELVCGTVSGYFAKVNKDIYIPLPSVRNK